MTWLGIDIGATKILAATVLPGGAIASATRIPSGRADGRDAVFGRVLEACRTQIERHGRPAALGAGFAGLVDFRTGVVQSSIMLPGWERFPLAASLSETLGIPAVADNDATAAGYGEWTALGSPPDANLVMLTVGTGIGGAIIIGGRLYRGRTGTAAEFGNATIDWNGEPCWCGSRGCLNMLASATAIATRAAALGQEEPRSRLRGLREPPPLELVRELADQGDPAALRAIADGARALGAGVANIVNTLDPDRIILCGGVTELGDRWFDAVCAEVPRRAFREPASRVRIERSRIGPAAGAFGAACLARDHLGGGG